MLLTSLDGGRSIAELREIGAIAEEWGRQTCQPRGMLEDLIYVRIFRMENKIKQLTAIVYINIYMLCVCVCVHECVSTLVTSFLNLEK